LISSHQVLILLSAQREFLSMNQVSLVLIGLARICPISRDNGVSLPDRLTREPLVSVDLLCRIDPEEACICWPLRYVDEHPFSVISHSPRDACELDCYLGPVIPLSVLYTQQVLLISRHFLEVGMRCPISCDGFEFSETSEGWRKNFYCGICRYKFSVRSSVMDSESLITEELLSTEL